MSGSAEKRAGLGRVREAWLSWRGEEWAGQVHAAEPVE